MVGSLISHYRILHELGEGGMGIVYRAEDLQLRRQVALKFLRAHVSADPENLARFQREARIASGLNHPHICTIHDLGEHQGRPFIVMELLEGRTLKQLLADGPLSLDRALHIAVQTADALEAAHERGIIHRDIKPANLFVDDGDHVKILDFGVAKLLEDQVESAAQLPSDASDTFQVPVSDDLTGPNTMIGTAAYMSPEQARREPLDGRSDVFSFGAVFYEMVTGQRAVPGDDRLAVLAQLLGGRLVRPRQLNPDVPVEVERIIGRSMEPNRERRYGSAAELLDDLLRVRQQFFPERSGPRAVVSGPLPPTASSARRKVMIAAATGIVIVALAGIALLAPRDSRPALRDTVLLAAFVNSTPVEDLDQALSAALAVHLEQSPFLDISPREQVRETLRLMGRSPDERLTRDLAREVCQRLDLKAMLEGSVAPLGSHFVVALEATDCRTGEAIAREQREADDADQVLRALGGIASSMRTRLGESLPSLRRFDVPIEQATTPSLDALKAYALGLAERAAGREVESIAFFNRAIELDDDFAAAHTMLSTVYGGIGELGRAERHARIAYTQRQHVSERERLFVTHQYHDRVTGNTQQAIVALEQWKQAYPRDVRPPSTLSVVYIRQGRYEEAIAEAEEALRRRAGHPFALSNLAFAYRALGRYDEARDAALKAVALGVETTPTRRLLYQLALMNGDPSAGEHLEWARGNTREFELLLASAQAAAYEGRLREARQLFRRSADVAAARGLTGTASGMAAHEAWTEALYDRGESGERVRATLERVPLPPQGAGGVARLRSAVALALAGLVDEALRIAEDARVAYPESTPVQTILLPIVRAAVLLDRNQPDRALAALEAAAPNDFGLSALLLPPYLRGEAYLAAGHAEDAAREFRQVLEHRGVDPFSPILPRAQLGLARAFRATGDIVQSRQAYEQLLRTWQGADPDLPLLARVRAEHARLSGS